MQSTLTITDLELQTRLGITEDERKNPQRVLVTVSFPVKTEKAAETDSIKGVIDYAKVRGEILDLAKTERKTVERLAEDIASTLLAKHKIPSVTVTVKKFPFLDAASVELQITRTR